MKSRPYTCFSVSLMVFSFFLGVDRSLSQTDPAYSKGLIRGAKREGKLVWYTATNNVDNQMIVAGFRRLYPFVEVELLRTSGEKLRTRILAEAAADRYFSDAVSLNGMEMALLKSKGLLLDYRPPEAKAYPEGSKDSDGVYTGIYARNFVIGYNTAMVSENDKPKDWPDLLRPEWKEKIGLDEEEFEWYGGLIDYWGKEKTINFMKALAHQQLQLRRGHSLLGQLLAAGEFPIAIVFPYHVEQLKHKGAPVDWVTTTDPIVTSISCVAALAKAPHPNAAKLFVNFLLSEQGQNIIRDRFRVPIRPGVIPLAPTLEQSKLKIHYVPGDLFKKISQYEKEFRDIFWKRR
jgi:iron(III) transport system substrate-binding protein